MSSHTHYDFIIAGSGFGGALSALNLAQKGRSVLVIERGVWPKRDDTCWDEEALHLKDHLYRSRVPFYVDQKQGDFDKEWADDTVGGMSTLYGAVSFRMREEDFLGAPQEDTSMRDTSCAWPYGYRELEPFYDRAEEILGIAGIRGKDITEPPKKNDYLHEPVTVLSRPSKKIWDAAKKSGLHPFFLPMAINFSGKYGKEKCISCSTCDHYLCKIEAKNDLAVMVLPPAIEAGAVVLDDTRVTEITTEGKKATGVLTVNQSTGEKSHFTAENVILAGGALSSPHLLLASGIDELTGNKNIGRHLMRHSNGVVAGIFPTRSNPEKTLQKQVGIADYYHGDPEGREGPEGPWGMIQDVSSIGKGVIKDNSPFGLKNIAAFVSDFLINLLVIAEDMPRFENRVYIDNGEKDIYGMPLLKIHHRYTKRDIQVRDILYRKAKKILRKAGALFFYTMPIETFSHALGTCRMGSDPESSVVDPQCRVHGMKNLYVIDGGSMPAGGSVNPSLTIAAMALKATDEM